MPVAPHHLCVMLRLVGGRSFNLCIDTPVCHLLYKQRKTSSLFCPTHMEQLANAVAGMLLLLQQHYGCLIHMLHGLSTQTMAVRDMDLVARGRGGTAHFSRSVS